jgi:hypothetical protein
MPYHHHHRRRTTKKLMSTPPLPLLLKRNDLLGINLQRMIMMRVRVIVMLTAMRLLNKDLNVHQMMY